MLNINFRSVRNKEIEILNTVLQVDPDIIIGTETWLNTNEASSTFLPDGFNYYRKDRDSRGGGVLIGTRKGIKCTIMDCGMVCPSSELILVEVKHTGGKSIYIMAAYRPEKNLACFTDIKDSFNRNNITKDDSIIIGGDFNIPEYDWKRGTYKGKSALLEDMQAMMEEFSLEQKVLQPTRTTSGSSTILDLVYTNNNKGKIEIMKGVSDHDLVKLDYPTNAHIKLAKKDTKVIKMYNKVDTMSMLNDALCHYEDFETGAANKDLNENWNTFKKDLKDLVARHVPTKTIKVGEEIKPWVSNAMKKLIKRKRKTKRNQSKYFLHKRQSKQDNLDELIKDQLRQEKERYMRSFSLKKQRNIWKYVNKYRKDKSDWEDLFDKDSNKMCSTDEEKGNLLNTTFQKAFTKSGDTNTPTFEPRTNKEMPTIVFTEDGIEKMILALDSSKSPGPDGVTARDLRLIAPVAAKYLCTIFSQSLMEGDIPDDWKNANISPIFKNGPKSDPRNYRPISLTSIPCKLMEHIMISNIMKFLTENNLLNNEQYGFRSGASTELMLVAVIDKIMKQVQNGGQVDAIVIDLVRAFDKVSHPYLLHKLRGYGLGDKTVKWYSAFLTNRKQRVVINGTSSFEAEVSSGVPQGSVSGPVLFILYINDLLDGIKVNKAYFADDGTIFHKIVSKEDQEKLNKELEEVRNWCEKWKMEVNWDKTHLIRFTKRREGNALSHEYSINGKILKESKAIKLLGVTVRDDLKWNDHVENVCKKASRQLYLLTHLIKETPQPVKMLIYKALVRPHLEYASSVWSPSEDNLIKALEGVQRRAIRAIVNNYDRTISVTTKREELNLEELHTRRHHRRIINFYKIVNNRTIINPWEHVRPMVYKGRHDHDRKFSRELCCNRFYAESFFPSTIKSWNDLKPELATCKKLEKFIKMVCNLVKC